MLDRLEPWKRNLALGVLAALTLWFAWEIRAVLNPLVLGYLLAFIAHPMVMKLERRGWSRRASANIIFSIFGLGAIVVGVGLFVQGRGLTRELANSEVWERAEERVEEALRQAESWLPIRDDEPLDADAGADAGAEDEDGPLADPGADPSADAAGPAATEEVEDESVVGLLQELWGQLSEEQAEGAQRAALRGAGGALSLLRQWFGSIFALGTLLFLLPLYTYFLLFELDRIHRFVKRYIPVRERERVSRVGRQIGEVLANFFRGRLVVCFVKGVLLSLGLFAAGIDYALLIGMASGFLSLIPFVGPFLGFVFALVVGVINPQMTPFALLLRAGLVFGIAELLEGYVLVPKILGETLGLHPVVVLVSVFAGGAALGMFGFLIALPLTASIVILVREFVLPALAAFADENESSEDDSRPDGAGV